MEGSRENRAKPKQSQLYLGTGPEPKEILQKFKDAKAKAEFKDAKAKAEFKRQKAYVFLDRLLDTFTQRYVYLLSLSPLIVHSV